MNSRERLLAALALEAPDRVPISTYELVGYDARAWENQQPSYSELMDVIREQTDCICMWNPGSNESFLGSASETDVAVEQWREGAASATRRTLRTPSGDLTQTTKVMDGVHTVWQTEHWCKSPQDVDRALSVPYEAVVYDASDYARISQEVGHQGIIMASVGDPLLMTAELIAFGEYTVWALTEPEHFARTLAILHERCFANLKCMLAAQVVDLYRIVGPEYATPPYLPPALFDRFVTPYVAEMVDLIHASGAKARLHCHGRIGRVLDMILRTGADGLDPCEPPPDGDITLAELKRNAGRRMCLFGNLELKLLERGTAAEVEGAVAECMRAAKQGGGYVIMPTAAPINVPLAAKTQENYVRFIEAAVKFGEY